MVIDTSIIVAIFLHEKGFEQLLIRILTARAPCISAVSYMEAAMVLAGRSGVGVESEIDRFLAQARVAIVPVSVTNAKIARQAFLTYGKGRHPARLNFGDCFAYALAKQQNKPLLFKGSDFSQTDLQRA